MIAAGETQFGVYVHWPFCAAKCPYCDFNSHVAGVIDHEHWARALLSELDGYEEETFEVDVLSEINARDEPGLRATRPTRRCSAARSRPRLLQINQSRSRLNLSTLCRAR